MAATELAVANLALTRIGHTKAITSLSSTTDNAAVVCNTLFDEVRDQVLAAFPWPFATKWALLSRVDAAATAYNAATGYTTGQMCTYDESSWVSIYATANTGNTPGADGSEAYWALLHDTYSYVYTYPTDCVAPRYIYSGSRTPLAAERIEFAVESNRALTGTVIATDMEDASLVYTARVETTTLWPPLFTSAFAWRLAAELVRPLNAKADLERFALDRSEMEISRAFAQGMNTQQLHEGETAAIAVRS